MLLGLLEEVKQLKNLVKEKENTIMGLQQRIDDLEKHTRMEDIFINGLDIKYQSYASTTANRSGEDAWTEELQTLEGQVVNFLVNKNIKINDANIAACHTLRIKMQNLE